MQLVGLVARQRRQRAGRIRGCGRSVECEDCAERAAQRCVGV